VLNIRGRWVVVLLLAFATAGVTPQLGGTTGNAVALIGVVTIGILSALKLESISTLRFPLLVFLLLAALIVVRAAVSVVQVENTSLVRSARPAVYLLVSTITVLIIPNTIEVREAIMGTLISVTVVSGAAILGIVIGSPIAGVSLVEMGLVNKFIVFGEGELRPVALSIFANPNRLAAFAIAGVIGGAGVWYTERNVYGLFAAIIAALTIVLTGSRTPFFAILMALVPVTLLSLNLRWALILWVGMFMAAVPIAVLTTVIDASFVGLISRPRAELWAGAVQAIAENPLFGYGFGNSPTAIRDFVPSGWAGSQPHNSYVKIAVSGGFPVAFLYGALLFGSIISRVRAGVSKGTFIWVVLSVSYLSVQVFESYSMFSLTPTCLLIGLSTGYIIHNRDFSGDLALQPK